MDIANLIETETGQAICLPASYRLPGNKVYHKRQGVAIIVLPIDQAWQPLLDSLSKFDPDFMEDRNQPPQQERPKLFD